jgi:hypothetical protein
MGWIRVEPSCTGLLRPARTAVHGPWPCQARSAPQPTATWPVPTWQPTGLGGICMANARAAHLGGDRVMAATLARRRWRDSDMQRAKRRRREGKGTTASSAPQGRQRRRLTGRRRGSVQLRRWKAASHGRWGPAGRERVAWGTAGTEEGWQWQRLLTRDGVAASSGDATATYRKKTEAACGQHALGRRVLYPIERPQDHATQAIQ